MVYGIARKKVLKFSLGPMRFKADDVDDDYYSWITPFDRYWLLCSHGIPAAFAGSAPPFGE